MTSMMGTTLEVGDKAIKKKKMEKANTGARRRSIHPRTAMPDKNKSEPNTAGKLSGRCPDN